VKKELSGDCDLDPKNETGDGAEKKASHTV
jgi:hypothetical protein